MSELPEMCVSGVNVMNQRQALEQLVGRDVVGAAIARLPRETREMYQALTHLSWVPVSMAEAILYAISAETGRDVDSLQTESVRLSVERTLRTVWRVLLRFTSDQALVQRTPVFYGKTFNRGELTSKIPVPGRAEIVLSGWPNARPLQLRGLGLGIETVLRAAGRRDVRMICEPTADGARFTATWRVRDFSR